MLSTVVGKQEKLLRKRAGEGGTERWLPTKVFAPTLGPPASFVREKDEAPVGNQLNRCGDSPQVSRALHAPLREKSFD